MIIESDYRGRNLVSVKVNYELDLHFSSYFWVWNFRLGISLIPHSPCCVFQIPNAPRKQKSGLSMDQFLGVSGVVSGATEKGLISTEPMKTF